MKTIISSIKISDIMNEISVLEVEYSAHEDKGKTANATVKQQRAMDHIADKIEALRLLISFLEPSTDECLAACLATGNAFALKSTAVEECHQSKEDWRAYERCIFGAMHYLKVHELPFADWCNLHLDPLHNIEWNDTVIMQKTPPESTAFESSIPQQSPTKQQVDNIMGNETTKPPVDIDEILNRQSLAIADIEGLHQALDTAVRLNQIEMFWPIHELIGELVESVKEDNRIVHDDWFSNRNQPLRSAA